MKDITKNYRLNKAVRAEYERDKGPLPSGYAKVSLTLVPVSSMVSTKVTVSIELEESWHLLEHELEGDCWKMLTEVEKQLQLEAVKGIKEGVATAFENFTFGRVTGIEVIVNGIFFHPMYSTVIAFRISSEHAVRLALEKALEQGDLIVAL